MSDLRTLRTFGTYKTGVHRPTFSDIDMQSRRWLIDRMTDAGLTATIDGVGNVIGRSPVAGPKLLMGSHIETQPYGGWLDGAMGVIFAVEMARAVVRQQHGSTGFSLPNVRFQSIMFLDEAELRGAPLVRLRLERGSSQLTITSRVEDGAWDEHAFMQLALQPEGASGALFVPAAVQAR